MQQRDIRLSNEAYEAQPWLIHDFVDDFTLLDVWALPVGGRLDEFDILVERMAAFDPTQADNAVVRALFVLRERLGQLLHLDDADKRYPIPGTAETSVSDRLPPELRGTVDGVAVGATLSKAGFVPLYRTDDEWTGEISNATVHGVLHFSWVNQGNDRYRGQMAIYVIPRGAPGRVYLRLIEPFRHLIVYPALMRQIERMWEQRPR